MSSIRLQSSDQTWSAEVPRVFKVGRESDCDIVSLDPTVSRHHAEVRAAGDGWEVVDLGSTHGTWVDGQQVQQASLTGTTSVRFGHSESGLDLLVTVAGAADPPPPPAADRPDGGAGATAFTPPAALAATVVPNALGLPGSQGAGLLVRTRHADLRFGTNAPVRIGREPGLEVTTNDAEVSRQHLVVEPRPDGWWLVDRSTSGSYVDGERITQHKLEEPVTVLLGHPTAGFEVELVPIVAAGQAQAGIARKKRRRTLAVVGAAAAALVLVVGGVTAAVVLSGDDGPQDVSSSSEDSGNGRNGGLSDADLDRAKAASVLLIAVGADGVPTHTGSGSIISDEGLILTNAHVASPSSQPEPSEFPDPEYLAVALPSTSDDTPATPTFRAVPIATDGYLDLSVIKIMTDIDGNPVETDALNLPEPMPIGDSDDLRTGDEITALGYPSLANLGASDELARPLTVTRGVVSTFKRDDIVETSRGEIDSDVRIASGNSGGASVNDSGELVGVNSAVIAADPNGVSSGGSSLIRPVNLASDVIQIARDGGDPSYVSPYIEQIPAAPEVPSDVSYQSAGWVRTGEEGTCAGSSTIEETQILSAARGEELYAEYLIAGVPDGTPVSFTLYTGDGSEVLDSIEQTWDFGTDEICIYAPFTTPKGIGLVNAALLVDGTAVLDNPLQFQ